MTPTQWIAKYVDRLHERWVMFDQAQLEAAEMIWNDAQLRALPPDEAAAKWLSPITAPVHRGCPSWIPIRKHLRPIATPLWRAPATCGENPIEGTVRLL